MALLYYGSAYTSATRCSSAHQERFDSLSSFYCRGARAAIICFDLTDRASFEIIQSKWIKKVADEAEQGCHICLVGTKADLVHAGSATRAVRSLDITPGRRARRAP